MEEVHITFHDTHTHTRTYVVIFKYNAFFLHILIDIRLCGYNICCMCVPHFRVPCCCSVIQLLQWHYFTEKLKPCPIVDFCSLCLPTQVTKARCFTWEERSFSPAQWIIGFVFFGVLRCLYARHKVVSLFHN